MWELVGTNGSSCLFDDVLFKQHQKLLMALQKSRLRKMLVKSVEFQGERRIEVATQENARQVCGISRWTKNWSCPLFVPYSRGRLIGQLNKMSGLGLGEHSVRIIHVHFLHYEKEKKQRLNVFSSGTDLFVVFLNTKLNKNGIVPLSRTIHTKIHSQYLYRNVVVCVCLFVSSEYF